MRSSGSSEPGSVLPRQRRGLSLDTIEAGGSIVLPIREIGAGLEEKFHLVGWVSVVLDAQPTGIPVGCASRTTLTHPTNSIPSVGWQGLRSAATPGLGPTREPSDRGCGGTQPLPPERLPSFPRSAWECRPGRSASSVDTPTPAPRSGEDGIPTQSVGTRGNRRVRCADHASGRRSAQRTLRGKMASSVNTYQDSACPESAPGSSRWTGGSRSWRRSRAGLELPGMRPRERGLMNAESSARTSSANRARLNRATWASPRAIRSARPAGSSARACIACGQGLGLGGVEIPGGVAPGLGQGAVAQGHDRAAAGQGLDDRQAEPLVVRRVEQGQGVGQQAAQDRLGDVPGADRPPRRGPGSGPPLVGPDEDQPMVRDASRRCRAKASRIAGTFRRRDRLPTKRKKGASPSPTDRRAPRDLRRSRGAGGGSPARGRG